MTHIRLFVLSLALAIIWPQLAAAATFTDDSIEQVIRPLLKQKCGACHGPKEQKASLRLDARHGVFRGGDGGSVVVPGKSNESPLIQRVESNDPDIQMPPEGDRLTADEIRVLREWIDSGADWPESDYDREALVDPRLKHWSFQPLSTAEPPSFSEADVAARQFVRNPIDAFILKSLREHRLEPNPEAASTTLVRRAFLDLTGLPPRPEDVDAFANLRDPQAWPQLVDSLLASPRYGERWAQHWLDVVRYADTHGFEVNTSRDNAWPYRDYVIRALNEDRPYDQFVREQIAGDLYGEDAATGFLVASAVLLPGQIGADDASKRLARQDALDEIIVGTSSAILGMTIGCARCHDHKFDPITQQDYYCLQAYFSGIDYGDRPLVDPGLQQRKVKAQELQPRIDELQKRLRDTVPLATVARTLIMDEEDTRYVQFLKTPNGPGQNPEGTKPGYRNDPGSRDRQANLSAGRYTWWNNVPGEDVAVWSPNVEGTFRLWLSWGAHGSGVHTRDARYILDRDGDLATKSDQEQLASVDQYYQAGIKEGMTEQVPLWSGLQDVGPVQLQPSSKIVLRGGDTGTGITADVLVLQESTSGDQGILPRLRAPVNARQTSEHFPKIAARYVRLTTTATSENDRYEPCIDELEVFGPTAPPENLALASRGVKPTSSGNYSDIGIHQLKHINDGLYGNSQSWISNERGRGWVQLEFPEPLEIDHIEWARDREGKFADRLPVRYEIAVSMDGQTWTTVASSQDRVPPETPWDPIQALLRDAPSQSEDEVAGLANELHLLKKTQTELLAPRMVFAGVFHAPDQTFLLRRGDPEQKVSETKPTLPAVFQTGPNAEALSQPGSTSNVMSPELTDEQTRRRELANWLSSPSNPLTARVFVNRLWQHHFGRGIVETPNDFGINGDAPSHPELLDWLAAEFIRSGWSIKHMHRLMMTSSTYRQSSAIRQQAAAADGNNEWLWRFASRRLESEAIRDSLLFVTGELNLKAGGPGFNFFKAKGGLDGFPPVEDFTEEELRRMIYAHHVRMEPVPVFGAFDCPDAGQSMPKRSRSTTALQALNLFNSPFVIQRAEKLEQRARREAGEDLQKQLLFVYRNTLGRAPSEDEVRILGEAAEKYGLAVVCRSLMNSNEFLFLP
ncbi:MAG: DUF1553 domain-containing protein [Planctomycetaceae bacterium]|nr:DUF1553 domain-containing protein [Planctomycetaceae bacterium]